MSEVVFSFIAPAINVDFYKDCYNSLNYNNSIPFEMIFVGPNPPTEDIGEHFRYIYSTVKPAQCIEVGAREAQGEYVIPVADDEKYSEGFLNKLYREIRSVDIDKYILSFIGVPPGKMNPKLFGRDNFRGIGFGWSGCYSRELWKKIGGIDRRFIHAHYDTDLQMRCYELGMTLRLVKDIYIREFVKFKSKGEREERLEWEKKKLYIRYKDYSRSLMDSLWVLPDGSVSKNRLFPVEPFDDKHIKEITQGEKGEW